jgi:hypothetical protein
MYQNLIEAIRKLMVVAGDMRDMGQGSTPYMVRRVASDVLEPFGLFVGYKSGDYHDSVELESLKAEGEPPIIWKEIR